MLKNKIAFVTGSTRGIGWSTAKLFAQNRAKIILNGVSDKNLLNERLKEIQTEYPGDHFAILCDVSKYDDVKGCYKLIFEKHRKLDILVNNAGILEDSLIGTITQDIIDKTLSVNVKGVIYNLQYASRLMSRNKSGSIINISSIIGRFGNTGQVVYSSSKAALIGITLSAAKELAPMNIRVNSIAPGLINTDMIKKMQPDKLDEIKNSILIGRIGKPEDVANAALFFASDNSSYITGQILGVDGAMLVWIFGIQARNTQEISP